MKFTKPLLSLPIALALSTCAANACTCDLHGGVSPRSQLRHSKAVFIGEVTKIVATTPDEQERGYSSHAVTFRVERYWKGVPTNEVTVYANLGGCPPFSMKKGEKYLVYAWSKRLSITCTRTRELESADEDLHDLGVGKEIKF